MDATTNDHTGSLFAVVDSMDVALVSDLFAGSARVVFGNGRPFVGAEQIRTGVAAFFETIAGQHHEIVNEWKLDNDNVVELRVTYDRMDGDQVTIPVVTIFRTDRSGKIDDYRVYFDPAPIYA